MTTRAKDSSSISDSLPARQLVDQWRAKARGWMQAKQTGVSLIASAYRECADELAALLDPAPQLTEKKEDDHPRVAPSVPCVAPVGSTAEQGQGEQSSPAPEHAPCSFCDLSIYETWPMVTRECPDGRSVAICQACAIELAETLSPEEASSPMIPPSLALRLLPELRGYLDSLTITSDTIGDIRRQCFMPWDSEWNGIVRDETAQRERASRLDPAPPETNEEELTRRDRTGEPVVSSPPQPLNGDK